MKTAALVVTAVGLLCGPALADDDGAALYEGKVALEARLGSATGPRLPSGRLSCAGCHGADGRGGREGATPAPPINWAALSRATPSRPPYEQHALGRLLREGIAPDGSIISPLMPRFQVSEPQLAALIHHLQRVDDVERIGLTSGSIALRLPSADPARAAALAAISAFNAEGGSFGRQAIVAEPAFLDLGQAVTDLLPRLRAAEDLRLASLLKQEPGLDDVAGTLDQLGPRFAALRARGKTPVIIGPSAKAISWALTAQAGANGAQDYAAARAALNLLRQEGRDLARSRAMKRIATAELSAEIHVHRNDALRARAAAAEQPQ